MQRLHNTTTPVIELEPVREQKPGHKPRGLWYAFGPEWLDWCRYEMPHWIYPHWFEFQFRPEARVLHLATPDEIRAFGRAYNVPYPGCSELDTYRVDWAQVAAKYDAIEINPYQWECRHDRACSWYYSWDVASGCCWNTDVLLITPTERPPSEETDDDSAAA